MSPSRPCAGCRFQLNPDLPEDRSAAQKEYIERKWGPGRGPEVYLPALQASAAEVGVPFAFENITVQPNTLQAHRLLTYAEREGRQDEVAEVLFKAYFVDGADLTDANVLADVGCAWRGSIARRRSSYLESDTDRAEVAQADLEARSAGIGGVPILHLRSAKSASPARRRPKCCCRPWSRRSPRSEGGPAGGSR